MSFPSHEASPSSLSYPCGEGSNEEDGDAPPDGDSAPLLIAHEMSTRASCSPDLVRTGSCSDETLCSKNTSLGYHHEEHLVKGSLGAPTGSPLTMSALRSVLRRKGQRGRNLSVTFNESLNQFREPDYIILFNGDSEPQLVSLRSLELRLSAPTSNAVDAVTLSPPDGYKDCFNRGLLMKNKEKQGVEVDPRDAGWPGEVHAHAPSCPRSNLPDVVTSQRQRITMENMRHHEYFPEDKEHQYNTRTGILKHGKFWKNEKSKKSMHKHDKKKRGVRFSGRDQYATLEAIPSEEQTVSSKAVNPGLKELSILLGKDQWQVDLGSVATDQRYLQHRMNVPVAPQEPKQQLIDPPQMEDEHIGESMKRYEEMRRKLAGVEGRETNSESSDESKSSNDSQSSDCVTTVMRIRRLENADVAQVAGGVMRSNSEVRRAIEQNALRRSLIKHSDARKRDTNKNDRTEKKGSSILEKLKWLTASEDVKNGNSEDKSSMQEHREAQHHAETHGGDTERPFEEAGESHPVNRVIQYRTLAEMFNKSTANKPSDFPIPVDAPEEWNLESNLIPSGLVILEDSEEEAKLSESTYTAIPAVSVCEAGSDDESDKLLYSGGVRYTREGTLMPPRRKELSVNKILSKYNRYTLNDIDEALHDDRSSSVPSSSQSSPRLSARGDFDGTSTTESGYSSNETNTELNILPPVDELAEFVKQDAQRLERLRMRYVEGDDFDHGFEKRPTVKGIKSKYDSSSDSSLSNELSGSMPRVNNSKQQITWSYRDVPNDSQIGNYGMQSYTHKRDGSPSVQDDAMCGENVCIDQLPPSQNVCCHHESQAYQQNNDIHLSGLMNYQAHTIPFDDGSNVRYENFEDIHSHNSQQAQNTIGIPPPLSYSSTHTHQSYVSRQHHPSCHVRRPNSLHEHLPSEEHVGKYNRPNNLETRPHSSLGQYTGSSRYPDDQLSSHSVHQPLSARTSFPGVSSMHSMTSPTQIQDPMIVHRHMSSHQQIPQCHPQNKTNYLHSPQEFVTGNSSPVGNNGSSILNCYPRIPSSSSEPSQSRNYRPQWNHGSGSSHISYTTTMVPDTSAQNKAIIEMNSKVDLLRDERGVPEGASSSPRSSYDSQYHSHGSPTREQSILLMHPHTLDIST